MSDRPETLEALLRTLFRAHPWHGVPAIGDAPETVHAYIEVVPGDGLKFEVDKPSGLLRLDRPQRFSSRPPAPYGFVPRTYCGPQVAARAGREDVRGDGDPLDICVLAEQRFTRADVLVRARPVGGLRLIDQGEADDKLIAVLEDDPAFGGLRELSEVPAALLARLRHYFLTYKETPGDAPRQVELAETYGRAEALETFARSRDDYHERFGAPQERLRHLLERDTGQA